MRECIAGEGGSCLTRLGEWFLREARWIPRSVVGSGARRAGRGRPEEGVGRVARGEGEGEGDGAGGSRGCGPRAEVSREIAYRNAGLPY